MFKKQNSNFINVEDIVEKISSVETKDVIKMYLTTTMLLIMKTDELSQEQLEDLIIIVDKLNNSLQLKMNYLKSNPEYKDDVMSLQEIISKYK